MFEFEKNNEAIGQYLLKLISENEKFKSQRRFCQAYISSVGGELNAEETRKMSNRLSQMIKGKKSIQTYDLPVFTKLLDVSCEELLSAGKTFVRRGNRLTNYDIALSKDQNLWEEYINHDDKPILNPDEYCNTVLDYAIKFNNFDFIKYLIDKEYIWFDNRDDNGFIHHFGAGTSIKGRNIGDVDYYFPHQLNNDKLRAKLVELSIRNNNLAILKVLRAREIQDYYNSIHLTYYKIDISKHYNKDLITSISNASNEIIDYFTDAFEIESRIKDKDGIVKKQKFMFPFISEVLDVLIAKNHEFVEFALRKGIEHNRESYKKLKSIINRIVETESIRYGSQSDEHFNTMKQSYLQGVLDCFTIIDTANIINISRNSAADGLITNIVQVKNDSMDIKIKHLIKDLNDSYEKIVNIKDEFEV